MYLTITSPSGILCRTTVGKVSLPGTVGAFTVLPGHAPLISQLKEGKIIYAKEGEEHVQDLKSGFVKVLKDTIEICIET